MPTIEFTVHPPSRPSPTPFSPPRKRFPRPNGSSYVALIAAAFRTSNVARPQSARGLKGFESSATALLAAVALSESPSSSVLDHVYTPRSASPPLKRRFTSTCSALYELTPSETHVQVFASAVFGLVAVGLKYVPAGTGCPAKAPHTARPVPGFSVEGNVAGQGAAGQTTGTGALASTPIIS